MLSLLRSTLRLRINVSSSSPFVQAEQTVLAKIISESSETYRVRYSVFEIELVGLATEGDYNDYEEIISKTDPRIIDHF